MKIPKSFKLYGQTIDVEWVDHLRNLDDARGSAVFRTNKIEIQRPSAQVPIPQCSLEQTFCHELMHWIFYSVYEHGEDNEGWLHQNEQLVTKCAGLLHQALATMEYADDL